MRLVQPLLRFSFALFVIAVNLDVLIVQTANPRPPPVPVGSGAPPVVVHSTERATLDDCWWQDHHGQHVMSVTGSPFAMGRCNAALADQVLDMQQASLLSTMDGFFPSKVVQYVVVRALLAVYGRIPQYFTRSDQQEILGLAHGRPETRSDLGPTYGRVSYYHAIHDISQAMVDNPLVACTAFAVSGPRTTNGHTLLARNFDFEGGRVFDEHKLVQIVRPRIGLAYVSVAWAGMVGAVSGMNESGLGVVLDAAGSDDYGVAGRPTTLVLRSILQHARTIDEAAAIVKNADLLVSDIFTLADGKTGELAVFEITPARVAIRRGEHVVGASNHFEADLHAGDRENARRRTEGTTTARMARLQELLEGPPLSPEDAVSILRDRSLVGGYRPAPGHRGTIDAWIAAHSVVFDLTELTFWVSTPPHTLGEYLKYDLRTLLVGNLPELGALPSAPELENGLWQKTVAARSLIERTEETEDQQKVELSQQALQAIPGYMPALRVLMESCAVLHRDECAKDAAREFLANKPAYAKHRRRAEEIAGR